MFTITAEVIDSRSNDKGEFEQVILTVSGHNLSDELIFEVAKQAFAVEAGWDVDDVARSISDWDIVEAGTSASTVRLSF